MKRTLAFLALASALFVCVWVSRVVLAAEIVAFFVPLAGLFAIALVAVVGGLLPGLLLGIAYGPIDPPPIFGKAFAVAVGASVIELALASAAVSWWSFRTWWVLPLESATLVISFPTAAWVSSALTAGAPPVARRVAGIVLYGLLTLGAAVLAMPLVLAP